MSKKQTPILDIVDMSKGFVLKDGGLYVLGADDLVEPTNDFLRALKPGDIAFALVKNDTHLKSEYALSNEASYGFPFHQGFGTYDHEYAVDIGILDSKMPVYWMLKNEFDMWADKKDLGLDISEMDFASDEERKAYEHLFYVSRMLSPGRYNYLMPRDEFFKDLIANEVIIIGVATDYCVRDAIKGYLARGFKVTLLSDLTTGIYDTSILGGVANWDELVEANFADAVKSGQLKTMTSVAWLETA